MRYFLGLLLLVTLVTRAQPLPGIEEKTAGMHKFEGFQNFYWDEHLGKIWWELSRFDQEFLYQVSLPAGLGSNDIGLDRGLLGSTSIVRFTRVARKVLLVQPNYDYRASSPDPREQKAVTESFAQSVIWGFTVEAESGGRVLVDATDFLLRDAIRAGQRLKNLQQGNYSVDKSRSAIFMERTRDFPFNTEFEATITLGTTDSEQGSFLSAVVPSSGSITLRMHHSLVQLPDNDYQPRVFDPRSSFGPISYFDYSTPVAEPIAKYFITRHRLHKKDPAAAVSEAVKPIIYYLDNGTPEPIRSALLEGAGWWNQAFEAAGYKNAFQVKILPDSADPMDIRYNMINWVHRSTRGWSYGEAVVDPRTGEIIKGQVSLGSLRVRQDYLIFSGLLAPFASGLPAADPMLAMALDRLRQLAAHEVGHTLGLMHNYASSANDRASVMDYPQPLIRVDKSGELDYSQAYQHGIGEWDKVAINWGYRDFGTDPAQAEKLNGILAAALKKGLQFISDRDARAAGGLHPQAHLWDNGSDAVTELGEVLKVRQKALQNFGENNLRPGWPMAMLEDVLVPVYFYHRYQLEAVAKWVGGMNYTYALRGDGQLVTRALTREQQLRALNALIGCLEPRQLQLPEQIAKLIPPRPAGYEFTRELFKKRTGLAFDALSPAEALTDYVFGFLFNSERLSRMTQYEQEGGLGVMEMIRLLVNATWKAQPEKGLARLIQYQNQQLLLGYLLNLTLDENANFAARAAGQQALDELKKMLEAKLKLSGDPQERGQWSLALERMRKPEKPKALPHFEMPPGAPIGCGEPEELYRGPGK